MADTSPQLTPPEPRKLLAFGPTETTAIPKRDPDGPKPPFQPVRRPKTDFKLVSNPLDPDSDGDGLTDGAEVNVYGTKPLDRDTDDDLSLDGPEVTNGTDPLTPERVPAGGQAAFTLYVPSTVAPTAVEENEFRNLYQWRYLLEDPSPEVFPGDFFELFWNDDPFVYDPVTFECVDQNTSQCQIFDDFIEDWVNDNGSGICWFGRGTCVTDDDQRRDFISGVLSAQAVFNLEGSFSNRFMGVNATVSCARVGYSDCFSLLGEFLDPSVPEPTDIRTSTAAWSTLSAAVATRKPTNFRAPNGLVEAIVGRLIVQGPDIVRKLEEDADDSVKREAIRQCVTQADLALTPLDGNGQHPCQVRPVYLPGSDVAEATTHRATAIAANPAFAVLEYVPAAERRTQLVGAGAITSRAWYRNDPRCAFTPAELENVTPERSDDLTQCDEYPNFASGQSGPPDASLLRIDKDDNLREGGLYSAFTRRAVCPSANRGDPFLVIPMTSTIGDESIGDASSPFAPRTFWICPR